MHRLLIHTQYLGLLTLLLVSCEQPGTPQPPAMETGKTITLAATTLSPPSPSPSPSLTAASPGPIIHDTDGPMYETLFQIPVGAGGIRYSGLSVPNALAVLPDGTLIIADPTDNRLLHYNAEGNLLGEIDLYSLGIVNVTDLVAARNELYLLEISFNVAPVRFRVSRLTFDGEVTAQYDIPEGYRWEEGLYGLGPAGEAGEIILEFYGETFRYYRLADAEGGNPGELGGISLFGRFYQVVFGDLLHEPRRNPAILADGLKVESAINLGGLIKILAVNPDGSFHVIREDLVNDLPALQGDISVHFLSVDGDQLGAARYPLSEWFAFVQRQMAAGPDGEVYALLPRQDSVDILRLNFYLQIEPLMPGTIGPHVGRSEIQP